MRKHNAWAYAKYKWDNSTKEIVSLSMEGEQHGKFSDVIYFRRKPKYGDFSKPIEVANLLNKGIGCTCQSFGITQNGDYIAFISRFITEGSVHQGAYLYRSTDKGQTWDSGTQLSVDGGYVYPLSGDIGDILTTSTGRLITWGWSGDKKSFVIYSDDNGYTWHYGIIGDGNVYNAMEPAFCELNDGTIISLLRNGVSMEFGTKSPALFTKSTDGGLTWSTPVESETITDMTENNGAFIKRQNSDIIEFINCSRFTQPDGNKSIYQSVFTQEQARNGYFGTQKRLLSAGGYSTDFGYPAALTTDENEVYLFFYTGYSANSNICYLVGASGAESYQNQPEHYNYDTGEEIKLNYTTSSVLPFEFEQGTLNAGVVGEIQEPSPDTSAMHFSRLRIVKYTSVKADTTYLLKVNDERFMLSVTQYDKDFNFIGETGMKNSDFYFSTSPDCNYVRAIVRRTDNSTVFVRDIQANTFTLERYTSNFTDSRLDFTGHVVHANGLVDRWGVITVSTVGDNSFDETFPTGLFGTCFQVQATFVTNGNSIANNLVSVGVVNKNGFTVYSRTENTGYIYWRAIGKK